MWQRKLRIPFPNRKILYLGNVPLKYNAEYPSCISSSSSSSSNSGVFLFPARIAWSSLSRRFVFHSRTRTHTHTCLWDVVHSFSCCCRIKNKSKRLHAVDLIFHLLALFSVLAILSFVYFVSLKFRLGKIKLIKKYNRKNCKVWYEHRCVHSTLSRQSLSFVRHSPLLTRRWN